MGSKPKIPDPVIPAKKPERSEGASPDDIVLGGEENMDNEGANSRRKGKRSLSRPTGNTGVAV